MTLDHFVSLVQGENSEAHYHYLATLLRRSGRADLPDTMTMLSLTNQASLQSLPDELLEKVLIACAENDDVESVAAVAATSRRLYRIIYISSDHHLWRSLFLALFDDPRHVRYRLLPGQLVHHLSRHRMQNLTCSRD